LTNRPQTRRLMSSRKQMIADSLFVVQIIAAITFCGAYTLRSVTDVTGSSVAQFGLVVMFSGLNLALSIGAHRASPSRTTRQGIATYAVWIVLMLILIGVVSTNSVYQWNEKDTTTLGTALVLIVIVLVIAGMKKVSPNDPMMKGLLAVAFKSVPQVLLAWKFFAEGASGTPGLSIWVGHFCIIIRLGQIYFMVREAGWDRNRVWLAISEISNGLSWIIATAVWVFV